MDSYKVRKGSKKKKGGEVFFDASGRDADPATHGNDGAEGEDGGRGTAKNGCDGTDAHSTTPGEAEGQLTITESIYCDVPLPVLNFGDVNSLSTV
jgi:hypothetical protein